MNVFLDDIRNPDWVYGETDWLRVKTVGEFKKVVEENRDKIRKVSLDHDLGTKETGLDALNWLEREIFEGRFPQPIKVYSHTANPVADRVMNQAIKKIKEFYFNG